MTSVQKINNDLESQRITKNKTQNQQKIAYNTKEGKIINAFVKDPNLSLDETLDTLLISQNTIDMPSKVFEKETHSNKPLLYLAFISAFVMAALSGLTALIKNSSKKHLESTEEYLLPGITRNHCINNEIDQSIFSLVQSPNRKTILAAIGVISLASMAFIGKTFIDGCKEVWVKKREADIQKNLQENLIDVETQAFAGKIQIIRSMLSSKAKFFVENIGNTSSNNVNFQQNSNSKNTKQQNQKTVSIIALIMCSLGSIIGLGYLSMHNIRKSEEFANKSLKNIKSGLEQLIKDFNEGKPINDVKDHENNILTGDDAYKHVIENMLESIYAKPSEIEEYVNKMALSVKEKEDFINYLKSSMNQATEKANSAMGGSGRNKITYFSHVNDYLSFFYDWLMNPKNPQFKNLFFGITGVTMFAYLGKTISEAIKEVEVKKYNANTELELQKRLVATELRNFKTKKEAIIEPLCDEFLIQKNNGKPPEELKVMADNILFEIKNGPPFVYS